MTTDKQLIIIKKQLKTNRIAIFICFLFTAIDVCFNIFRLKPFIVSEVSYLGILVSSMGVLFTILAGYQIYNVLDFNNRLKKVDETKADMTDLMIKTNEKLSITEDAIHRVSAQIYNNRAITALDSNPIQASILILKSIYESLGVIKIENSMEDINNSLNNLRIAINKITSCDNNLEEVSVLLDFIKNNHNYPCISQQFSEIISLLKTKSNSI